MANQILMGMDGGGFFVPIAEALSVHRRVFAGLDEQIEIGRADGRPGGWCVGPTMPQHRETFARWLAHLNGPIARKLARAGSSQRKRLRCVEALWRLGVVADVVAPGVYRPEER